MTNTAVYLPYRTVISLTGPESREFLQGILTNDLAKVRSDRAIYAALLTPQGKVLFDFFITQKDDTFLLDCEADRKADLIRRLMLYRLRANVDIEDAGDAYEVWSIIDADNNFPKLEEEGAATPYEGGVLFVDPRHKEMGLRAILPETFARTLKDEGLEAYDDRRLSLGLSDGARDLLIEKDLALEANLDVHNGVDFGKGCYVGQELTARTKHRGKVRKRLFPIHFEQNAPAPETPIMKDGKLVGVIRFSQGNRALAQIRLDAIETNTDKLVCDGLAATLDAPDWLDAV